MRAVSSVANCVAVSPVVRWWVTVFSGVALRILLAFYPQFFAVWWGCCLVGGCLVSPSPHPSINRRLFRG